MSDPLDPPPLGGSDPLDPSGSSSAAALAALTQTATITRRSAVADGAGGQTVTWSTIGTVAVGLTTASRFMESVQGGALKAVTTWRGQFPVGTDLRPQDRVTVGGVVFEVTDSDSGRVGALVLTAQLVRFKS